MNILYLLVALMVCISIHEASHAWVAWKLGDPTARMEGRVSLNPLRHLDVLGTLMIFIAHFGWGKPVPFNYHNLRHPRRDAALIAIAGPLSNLFTAFLVMLLLKYIDFPPVLENAFMAVLTLSIVLFLFNLIPIAPLDGSKLVGLLIPLSQEDWYQRFLARGPMLIIALVVLDRIIDSATGFSFFGTYLQFGYELITVGLYLIT